VMPLGPLRAGLTAAQCEESFKSSSDRSSSWFPLTQNLANRAIVGTVKLANSEASIKIERVRRYRIFSYAAVSVAVISRQMCHLWAISWR
jgi:hypothetical protein